ncbi:MAG: hypothetical protein ABSB70_10985 [Candidatus Velthaea sp.]
MIAPPTRLAAPARTPTLAAGAAPADPGEAESTEAQGEVDARIAALVARATTAEDEALERQREEFDFVTRVRAETEREINALRDMAMEQMKQDDELLKKWIALI